jgi:hypothetical protein
MNGQDHTRFPEGTGPDAWHPSDDRTYSPGVTAQESHGFERERKSAISHRDKIRDWFERPLRSFKEEDSVVCLMVCLPLIEKLVKYRVRESGKGDEGGFYSLTPEKNPLLTELRKFLGVRTNSDALYFYDVIRNGLLHRAMPNKENKGRSFELRPERDGKSPLRIIEKAPDGTRLLQVFVWVLRDAVAGAVAESKTKMWSKDTTPLLEIYETKNFP